MWWSEFLKLLGLTKPFIYAAGVYGLFHWLDKSASAPAKKALSEWFTRRYSKNNVASAMVEIFDRLYTKPLWHWRGMLRSSLFTVIVTCLFVQTMFPPIFWIAYDVPEMRYHWLKYLLTNIVSDFISLLFIRQWLILGGYRPITTLLTGPLIGVVVIGVCYAVRDILNFSIEKGVFEWRFISEWGPWRIESLMGRGANRVIVFAAFTVLLWLPLFALGVLFIQGVNWALYAAGKMQWFLKQGRQRPLRAIGYVAAGIVFAVTSIAQVVWR